MISGGEVSWQTEPLLFVVGPIADGWAGSRSKNVEQVGVPHPSARENLQIIFVYRLWYAT